MPAPTTTTSKLSRFRMRNTVAHITHTCQYKFGPLEGHIYKLTRVERAPPTGVHHMLDPRVPPCTDLSDTPRAGLASRGRAQGELAARSVSRTKHSSLRTLNGCNSPSWRPGARRR